MGLGLRVLGFGERLVHRRKIGQGMYNFAFCKRGVGAR